MFHAQNINIFHLQTSYAIVYKYNIDVIVYDIPKPKIIKNNYNERVAVIFVKAK